MINDNNWIPVSEGLPEEHDTMFAKFKDTNNWNMGMFATSSDEVNVTVEFEDGKRKVTTSKTHDGKWLCEKGMAKLKVIAWKLLSEPYEKKEVSLGEIQPGKIVNIAGTDWIPLEHFTNGGTLCIRKDIWEYAAFDENNSNNWEISSLRKRLNTVFLSELNNRLKEYGYDIDLIKIEQDLVTDDGSTYGFCKDKVTLLTADQCRKYKPYLEQLKGNCCWSLTAHSTTNNLIRIVYPDGTLSYYGRCNSRDGVRPVCMFPSSIRVTE